MQEVTREQVNAAVRRHFRAEPMVIAMVSEHAAALAEALAAGADSPITYDIPRPAAVFAEEAIIARYPLPIPREQIRIVPVEGMFEK